MTNFEISNDLILKSLKINGSIRLIERSFQSGQDPILENSDPAQPITNSQISEDQAFHVEFRLTIKGAFASVIRLGLWELKVYFKRMGSGSGDLTVRKLTKSITVNGQEELLGTIPLAANTFESGIYNVAATIQWLDLDNKPAPITAFEDLGTISIYEKKSQVTLPSTAFISGTILSPLGKPMPNVEVHLKGNKNETTFTNAQGVYSFTGLLNGSYSVEPIKDINPTNGVSTFDIVLISKHILGVQTLDDPLKILAADANNDGKITTLDMIEIRKIILHINDSFSKSTSWRFTPSNRKIEINNLNNIQNIDFTGVKIGDVNNSADASQ